MADVEFVAAIKDQLVKAYYDQRMDDFNFDRTPEEIESDKQWILARFLETAYQYLERMRQEKIGEMKTIMNALPDVWRQHYRMRWINMVRGVAAEFRQAEQDDIQVSDILINYVERQQ